MPIINLVYNSQTADGILREHILRTQIIIDGNYIITHQNITGLQQFIIRYDERMRVFNLFIDFGNQRINANQLLL